VFLLTFSADGWPVLAAFFAAKVGFHDSAWWILHAAVASSRVPPFEHREGWGSLALDRMLVSRFILQPERWATLPLSGH